MNDTAQAAGPSALNRLIGVVQVAGGALEVTFGSGMMAAPTGITQVGGVILIAHGGDTIIAGFRSIWTGQLQSSGTQQLGAAAARGLGAGERAAQIVGSGVDLAAGVGPSIAASISRRIAIAGAERSATRVAIAYLDLGAYRLGHNAVGVRLGGRDVWVEFRGRPMGEVVPMFGGPSRHYVVTEIAVSAGQAERARQASRVLLASGQQAWGYLGPNCTTVVRTVLGEAGIVVPEWSRTPFLLHLGVNWGAEISILGGSTGTLAPAGARR